MAKKESHPEFSSPQGYLLLETTKRGIRDGTNIPAGYKDAAQSVDEVISDLSVSGNVDQRNVTSPEPSFPFAKFNVRGAVKSDRQSNLTVDPRVHFINGRRRYIEFGCDPGAETVRNYGTLGHVFGLTSAAAGANGTDADGVARTISTTAVAGTDCFWYATTIANGFHQLRHYPLLHMTVKFPAVTGFRWYMGIADANLYGSDAPAATNYIALRFSPASAGDTTFKLRSSNAVDTGSVDTLVTVAANTLYEIDLWSAGGVAYCRINNGSIIGNSTAIPASTANMNSDLGMWMRSVTGGTAYTMTCYTGCFSQGS